MKNTVTGILAHDELLKEDIIQLLKTDVKERNIIYQKSSEIKEQYVGKKAYYRGLIEFSNICYKDCLYCGIRAGNKKQERYNLTDEDILKAAKFAHENKFGSIVLQSGEREDKEFINRIDNLLKKIKQISNNELGITISLGEQTEETYKRWFESGAHRYLLRIESSSKELFEKIHPVNKKHSFERRLECLYALQEVGYQTGTGVMVGLPFQTLEHLADDLLFFKSFSIDMVGMGPYIEHQETPLYEFRNTLLPLNERFNLTLKMIAILRIMMKDINIASATALQAIDPAGREKAIKIGANVIMPNITPTIHRTNYQLYENKPCIDESADDCGNCMEARIHLAGDEVGFGEWGDSKHYYKRQKI
ncbi:MAG: [FeFe] hydrogenase H-cluster radical SAM maturase HydE [Chlorobi bacterium]|nr:[FeFe] hydrogenase H-cluster radical SAM maturase HydE [Chlorobiota bacterium]